MKRVAIIITLSIVAVIGLSCRRGPTQQQASGLIPTAGRPAALKSIDYITDEAKVIDEAPRKQLQTTLAALKAHKHIDFAVVTVKTTGAQSARDYSLALARERKNNSNEENVSGLLLLVAVDDRSWHIQITNNLEDELTNEVLTNLSTPMTDAFREKRYGEGIVKYVNAVIAELERKLTAESTKNAKNS
jgi:uncharacterized membrane protein YgcG